MTDLVFNFQNSHSNCYMNSSYQLLFSIKEIYDLKNCENWLPQYIVYIKRFIFFKEDLQNFLDKNVVLHLYKFLSKIHSTSGINATEKLTIQN